VDRTVEIVREHTRNVYFRKWEDDFAKARNFGLDQATSDLIFWMDSDDTLTEKTREGIKIIASNNDLHAAYMFKIHSIYTSEWAQGWLNDYYHLKLFPNCTGIRFNNFSVNMHEGVVDDVMRYKDIEIRAVDLTIEHHGYETDELLESKIQRDIRLAMNDEGFYYQFRIGKYFFVYHDCEFALWTNGTNLLARQEFKLINKIAMPIIEDPVNGVKPEDSIRLIEAANRMIHTHEDTIKSVENLLQIELQRLNAFQNNQVQGGVA
jgi:glycosyltransferase involved in cell wall biosynthesis